MNPRVLRKGSRAMVLPKLPVRKHLARLAIACAWLVTSGCATMPRDRVERALYNDLRKAVELSEDGGWVVDRAQTRVNAEMIMRSVCQVDPALRDDLEAWLNGQIALTGGPAERIYRENGGNLGAASVALSLERTRTLLRYGIAHAADDCPFWLKPNPRFNGTQNDAGRLVLLAETHGFATYLVNSRVPAFGGGGRLLVGHGVGTQLTIAVGGEVAGSGAFVSTGGKGSLDTTLTVAAPVLLRIARFSRILDFELAPVARFNPGQDSLPPGGRVEVGVGITAMRGSAFMPYGMLYMGYEYHPTTRTAPADHTLQVGTRLSVDWAP
jgi:hypothetical protein